MALAKQSRGGMSGWLAAVLLALGIFAAVTKPADNTPDSAETEVLVVEVSLQD